MKKLKRGSLKTKIFITDSNIQKIKNIALNSLLSAFKTILNIPKIIYFMKKFLFKNIFFKVELLLNYENFELIRELNRKKQATKISQIQSRTGVFKL
jgi:hypothetical protein